MKHVSSPRRFFARGPFARGPFVTLAAVATFAAGCASAPTSVATPQAPARIAQAEDARDPSSTMDGGRATSPNGKAAPSPRSTKAAPLPGSGIAFYEDDYAAAVDEAVRTGKPLFVDEWAPWCHSCLSMRSYVLTSEELRPFADKLVWLSIDTEKENENREALRKLPIAAWPTIWVIDPKAHKVALRWAGAPTGKETAQLLALSLEALAGTASSKAARALLDAQQAGAEGRSADALHAYRQAVDAGAEPGLRDRAVEGLVSALAGAKDAEACAMTADKELASMKPGTPRIVTATTALGCAAELPKAGDAAKARRSKLLASLLSQSRALAADDALPVLADDRSSLYEAIVGTLSGENRTVEARAVAGAWASFLEREAKGATSKEARVVFDAHRLLAYLAMGKPELALPMLDESAKDFPADYNPPARRARALLAMKKLELAEAAIDEALAKVYGPREISLRALQADILEAKKQPAKLEAALRAGLERTADMQLTAGQTRGREALAARLQALLAKKAVGGNAT